MKKGIYSIVLLFFCCLFICSCAKEPVKTVSSLIDSIEISEMYGSEFVYNGVTQISKGKDTYNIRYNSIIKVGIDTSDLSIQVDEKDKRISVTIPEMRILDIQIDSSSLDYLPSKPNLTIKEILKECESDARENASAETFISDSVSPNNETNSILYSIAEENICSAIEGIILPLIEDTDYTLDMYRIRATYSTEVIR